MYYGSDEHMQAQLQIIFIRFLRDACTGRGGLWPFLKHCSGQVYNNEWLQVVTARQLLLVTLHGCAVAMLNKAISVLLWCTEIACASH